MARKRTASETTLKPDPRYNNKLASKFINCLMWQGKKATAQRIFYGAMDQIKKRMPDAEPIDVFVQAVEHVKPTVEVRSKRVGGATYQVPMQVNRIAAAKPGDPLAHHRVPFQGRPADVPSPGRRTHGRLPPRRRGHDQARKHHQDGRLEQGVRALRLVIIGPLSLVLSPLLTVLVERTRDKGQRTE